jgi:hypothetical protein
VAGGDNIAIGSSALFFDNTSTCNKNIAIGSGALYNSAGGYENIAVGYQAMYTGGITGYDNISIGYQTGFAVTSGFNNTLIGYKAAYTLTTGARNLIIGYYVSTPAIGTNDYFALGYNATKLLEGSFVSGSEYLKSNYQFQTIASTITKAGLNIPHGAAPTSPVNGDMWTTTAGLYIRINGTTVGPLN